MCVQKTHDVALMANSEDILEGTLAEMKTP